MDERTLVRRSKLLSRVLRHQPQMAGLRLAEGGWVEVDDLLRGLHERVGVTLTRADLEEIVANNNKQRFAFDETGVRIRARQGHSVAVDLQLTPVEPPATLYHGTGAHSAAAIQREGLKKMRRHHVHLSPDIATARIVGRRHGPPVILAVDAAALAVAGYSFYLTENHVWLVDAVPPQYLTLIEAPGDEAGDAREGGLGSDEAPEAV